jgi:hypothetical protein
MPLQIEAAVAASGTSNQNELHMPVDEGRSQAGSSSNALAITAMPLQFAAAVADVAGCRRTCVQL